MARIFSREIDLVNHADLIGDSFFHRFNVLASGGEYIQRRTPTVASVIADHKAAELKLNSRL